MCDMVLLILIRSMCDLCWWVIKVKKLRWGYYIKWFFGIILKYLVYIFLISIDVFNICKVKKKLISIGEGSFVFIGGLFFFWEL